MKEAKYYDSLQPFQKNMVLVFDEVRIKDSLVFDKHGLQVIGFVDVGDINNELLKFERSFEETEGKRLQERVAKHMLVFMVREFLSTWSFH